MSDQPYESPHSEIAPPLPATHPRLWNPQVAAGLSLLFTPAFGAILHGLNWRQLGNPGRARASFLWAAGILAFVAVLIFVPGIEIPQQLNTPISLGLLFGWYFSLGKSQVEEVKALGPAPAGYQKKSWWGPVFSALGAFILLFGAIFLTVSGELTAADVTATLKPSIEAEWQKKPEIQSSKVESIDLYPGQDGTFEGTVKGEINGEAVSLPVHVTTHAGGTFDWRLGE